MCKFWDIVKSGWLDNRTQRKRNRISMILMVLSLLIYIGVNSTVNSVNSSIHDILNSLQARVLTTGYVPEYDDTENMNFDKYMETLEEYFSDDERVRDVFFQIEDTTVSWLDTKDWLKEDDVQIIANAFYKPVLDFSEDSRLKAPEYGEVIIPKYIYGLGVYDNYTYFPGDDLIGKIIKIRYKDTYGAGHKDYKLKVIGTYDNIKSRVMGCHIFINSDMAREIMEYQNQRDYEYEEIYRQELEDMGLPPESYEASLQYKVGIYVSEDYEISKMQEELRNELGIAGWENITLDDELQSYFKYIVYVGNIVSFMLLFIAIINMIISSLNEVKDRKWEFALKMAMGYKRNDVVKIFFVEKLINMIKALIISLILLLVYSGIATYAIQELMEYWKKTYVIRLDGVAILISFVLVTISAFMGILAARISINSINVAETLKEGD